MAGEVRREVELGIGGNAGLEDTGGGTRGQLVEGTVEVQVVEVREGFNAQSLRV